MWKKYWLNPFPSFVAYTQRYFSNFLCVVCMRYRDNFFLFGRYILRLLPLHICTSYKMHTATYTCICIHMLDRQIFNRTLKIIKRKFFSDKKSIDIKIRLQKEKEKLYLIYFCCILCSEQFYLRAIRQSCVHTTWRHGILRNRKNMN